MALDKLLFDRLQSDRPVKAGLIGAGKFGSMFLNQIPSTPGLEIAWIADLDPARARRACAAVGWPDELTEKTEFSDDAARLIAAGEAEVVIEATGNPAAGIRHAREAARHGRVDDDSAIHLLQVDRQPFAAQPHLGHFIRRAVEAFRKRARPCRPVQAGSPAGGPEPPRAGRWPSESSPVVRRLPHGR